MRSQEASNLHCLEEKLSGGHPYWIKSFKRFADQWLPIQGGIRESVAVDEFLDDGYVATTIVTARAAELNSDGIAGLSKDHPA